MKILIHSRNGALAEDFRVISKAEGKGKNDLAAFDMAVEALELQLRKAHERAKDVGHDTLRNKAVND